MTFIKWPGRAVATIEGEGGVDELRSTIGTRPIVVPAFACAATVGIGVYMADTVAHGGFFITSMVSSAVLIATSPNLRQCHPARIVLSHGISTLVGLAVSIWFAPGPMVIALAVLIALSIVLYLDCLHPPALANAAIVQLQDAEGADFLIATAAAALALALFSFSFSITRRLWLGRSLRGHTLWRLPRR